MKKYLVIIILILLIGGIYIIFNENKKDNKPQVFDGISLVIKEGTLSNTGTEIIITDTVEDEEHTYGDSFRLEKKENGEWVKLDTIIKDYGFHAIGYHVDKNKKLEMKVNWEWIYGKLEDGEYRLIKDFAVSKNDYYIGSKEIYVEFVIGNLITIESIDEENKKIILNTIESEKLANMLKNLDYQKETCDGISSYNITYDNIIYGLEVFNSAYHITLAGKGESVLAKKNKEFFDILIKKYF